MSKRAIVTAIVSTLVSMVLNILIHGILFGNMYAEYADLWRPPEEFRMWLILAQTIAQIVVFIFIYERWIPVKSLGRGIAYGTLWGIVMGFGSASGYATLPVEPMVGWVWFVSGVLQMVVCGAIVGAMVKAPTGTE